MSLYNMMNGVNPATFVLLPMLGRKPEEYPRFRDCFLTDDNKIEVYTRVGGGNRGCGYGEEELYKDENFVKTFDDSFDSTYGSYAFNVPSKWEKDFNLILDNKYSEVSDEYVAVVKSIYPNSVDKINEIFERKEN